GTRLLLGRNVVRFEGERRLASVVTDRDERLEADLALVAIGVAPATEMVGGLGLDDDGGVPVDAFLEATDDLYAAGDVARFPEPVSGEWVRIEHWRLACQHGRLAARNMLGGAEAYGSVPFFWSAQKLALYYVGHAPGFDDVVLDGDPDEGRFIAWYIRGGRVVAALGSQRNREMCAIHELMRLRRMPTPDEVRAGFDALRALQSNPIG
ncbi:MAG: FAD-dependent oxidoreductase, partial [Geminicoccaceae bacterium]|nr:FAD-dependent oxidoreductase [Geminicoccaceae bacterium]